MGLRVHADTDACEGYANCIVAAPAIFSLDDDNMVQVDEAEPDDSAAAAVGEAVRSCPTAALSVTRD